MRRVVIAAAILTGLLAGAGCSGGSETAGSLGAAQVTAVGSTRRPRRWCATCSCRRPTLPARRARTVGLVRHTIARGPQLPAHVHPGVQLASIETGSLTYTLVSGTATVKRLSGVVESVPGPSTVTLGSGGSLTERGEMVHFGANPTAPLVILATLLTETGRVLAVPV